MVVRLFPANYLFSSLSAFALLGYLPMFVFTEGKYEQLGFLLWLSQNDQIHMLEMKGWKADDFCDSIDSAPREKCLCVSRRGRWCLPLPRLSFS